MSTKEREKFSSRIGFILVAAGCAVGLGNVWKFPYLCGQNGGAAFILIYFVCLAVLAFPILICELSVGRASQKSCAKSFHELQPKGSKWHLASYMMMAGSYVLMAFYTCVCGWMLYYFIDFVSGGFSDAALTTEQISSQFNNMLADPSKMMISTIVVIIAAISICSLGVQKGVEKITKIMMTGLLALIALLAVNSVTLTGASKGLEFYLVPNFDIIAQKGIGNVLFAAMSQAFFTLSIGVGSMAIFGSYLDKERSLTGEGVLITVLDTMVAIVAGLVIIPACFAFNISPDAGPSLIFVTMPNVFHQMPGGQIWGSLFFLFLLFAALSTVVAVFENIIVFAVDLFGWKRKKSVIVNLFILSALSVPCVLGFNVLKNFEPLGPGSGVLDLEDFIVSNNFLPLGALIFLLFCVSRYGWTWNSFLKEVDAGEGPQFPSKLKMFMMFVAPALIVIIYLKGYFDMFYEKGMAYFVPWMTIACAFLGFICYMMFSHSKKTVCCIEETQSNAQNNCQADELSKNDTNG